GSLYTAPRSSVNKGADVQGFHNVIGQPARRLVQFPFGNRRLLHPEPERRRLEHGLDHRLRAFQEIALGFEQCLETRNLRGLERTAKRPAAKGPDELEPASRVACAIMRARDQMPRIAAPES